MKQRGVARGVVQQAARERHTPSHREADEVREQCDVARARKAAEEKLRRAPRRSAAQRASRCAARASREAEEVRAGLTDRTGGVGCRSSGPTAASQTTHALAPTTTLAGVGA